jgi:hypothetical protein
MASGLEALYAASGIGLPLKTVSHFQSKRIPREIASATVACAMDALRAIKPNWSESKLSEDGGGDAMNSISNLVELRSVKHGRCVKDIYSAVHLRAPTYTYAPAEERQHLPNCLHVIVQDTFLQRYVYVCNLNFIVGTVLVISQRLDTGAMDPL